MWCFGSLATFAGALFTWKLRKHPLVALAGPVLANALIVPAYLPLLLQATGFYTIPFTSISLDGAWPFMYLFGLVSTGAGEAVIMYVLGYPSGVLLRAPRISRTARRSAPVPSRAQTRCGSHTQARAAGGHR